MPVVADRTRPATGTPRHGALCLDTDPELFFDPRPAVLEQTKQVCAPCPLKQECLAGAIQRAEPWGVWGGEILDAGVVMANKRPRGRPRKAVA